MGLINSCCCGCTLAQGTVGTGIMSMIRAIVSIAIGALFLSGYPQSEEFEDGPSHSKQENENLYSNWSKAMGWSFIVEGSVILLVTILMFVGVKTRRRGYLVPWLVVIGAGFALSIPTVIYRIATGNINLSFLLLWLGMTSLMIYLYLVVLSYYKSLQNCAFTMTPGMQPPNTVFSYSQPGYVIAPPPAEGGYSTVPGDFKPQPQYPSAAPPFSDSYYMPHQFQPPPPYSDVVHDEERK